MTKADILSIQIKTDLDILNHAFEEGYYNGDNEGFKKDLGRIIDKMNQWTALINSEIPEGKCIYCGKMTPQMHRFTDGDSDDVIGHEDFCHDECYEAILERI